MAGEGGEVPTRGHDAVPGGRDGSDGARAVCLRSEDRLQGAQLEYGQGAISVPHHGQVPIGDHSPLAQARLSCPALAGCGTHRFLSFQAQATSPRHSSPLYWHTISQLVNALVGSVRWL